jgi:CubicO group peptidase (beta-lactamase class C family)
MLKSEIDTQQEKLMKRWLFVCLFAFLAVSGSAIRAADTLDTAQIDTHVKDWMQMYDVPGASIALVRDGDVIYTRGYGVRDTTTQHPVNENTLFAIGSITKSFTSLAVAQLVDAGKIDLDSPVTAYLPDFKLSDAAATRKLTVRHVLAQTTGLESYADDALWYAGQIKTLQEAVDHIQKMALDGQPGEKYHYNNYNYALAGYLVEKVSGQPWADYLRQHILTPLAMDTANTNVSLSKKTNDFAAPHRLDIPEGMQPIPFFSNFPPIAPAGAINASAAEMAHYLQLQLSSGLYNGKQIVSQKMLREMHHEQVSTGTGGGDTLSQIGLSYGLGWVVGKLDGETLVWHNGGIDGFYAVMGFLPDRKTGVVVLTNADELIADPFATTVLLGLLEKLSGLKETAADTIEKTLGPLVKERQEKLAAARNYQAEPEALEALTGDYISPAIGTLTLERSGSLLTATVPSQGITGLKLVPYEPNGFLAGGLNAAPVTTFTIKKDANGTLTIYQDGTAIATRDDGKSAPSATYTDPHKRFTVTLPVGAAPTQMGDAAFMQRPNGILVVAAAEAEGRSLKDSALHFVQTMDAQFKGEPMDTRDVPIPNGPTWTQYIYTLPDGTIRAILVTRRGDMDYFVGVQAKTSDVQSLVPELNGLLTTFKIAD